MPMLIASLTAKQQDFASAHAVGLVEKSFLVGNVFMYHGDATGTDRWLVRADGRAAEHDHFLRGS
jgi:hypothetical protein